MVAACSVKKEITKWFMLLPYQSRVTFDQPSINLSSTIYNEGKRDRDSFLTVSSIVVQLHVARNFFAVDCCAIIVCLDFKLKQ